MNNHGETNPPSNPTRHEFPDDTPIATPLRWKRQGSTLDQIRAAIGLANREAEERGYETFEEANDFDVGDDFEPPTLHELRSIAADLNPEQLYEQVFKKSYQPPPVAAGKTDPDLPDNPNGGNPPIPTPPVTP